MKKYKFLSEKVLTFLNYGCNIIQVVKITSENNNYIK